MASKGQRRGEFGLNLERSLEVQKLRGERIQFNSSSMHFMGMWMAYYVQGSASVPWLIHTGPDQLEQSMW